MREVLSTGQSSLIEASLRQLLGFVHNTVDSIDKKEKESLNEKSFTSFHAESINDNLLKEMEKRMEKRNSINDVNLKNKFAATSVLGRDLRRLDFDSHPNEVRVRVRKLGLWN
jgi:hypothetical protein